MIFRWIISALGYVLLTCGALAQVGQIPSYLQPAPTASSYTGLLDIAIVGAKFAGALRAASTATAGTKAINLCDDLGNNCADISTDAGTGKLNSPGTLGTNDCTTSTTCRIKTIYDKSGALNCTGSAACDLTNAANASRPTLTWSCINSLPCAVFTGTQFLGSTGTFASISQIYSITAASNRTSGTANHTIPTSGGIGLTHSGTVNAMRPFAGSPGTVTNITDGSWHAFQAVFNGASSTLFCGGTAGTSCSNVGVSTTENPGAGAIGGAAITVGSGGSGTLLWTESYVWAADNTSVRSSLNSNQLTFWGPF